MALKDMDPTQRAEAIRSHIHGDQWEVDGQRIIGDNATFDADRLELTWMSHKDGTGKNHQVWPGHRPEDAGCHIEGLAKFG